MYTNTNTVWINIVIVLYTIYTYIEYIQKLLGNEDKVTLKRQSEGETDTTIQVSIELREELKGLGKKGETYEDVIRRCNL
jgi:hypothetical protein